MSKEAMKLALEALEESLGYVEEEAENAQRLYGQYPTRQARIQGLKDDVRKHMHAITALREALAEQPAPVQQEPVGMVKDLFTNSAWDKLDVRGSTKVYFSATPQPAQRKPMTDDELADLWYKQSLDWMEFARAIEAKLKEKNT